MAADQHACRAETLGRGRTSTSTAGEMGRSDAAGEQGLGSELDDSKILHEFLAGETAAARKVREWVRGALMGLRRTIGDEVEDLEQEILLGLTQQLKGYEAGPASLKTFVGIVARRRGIDHLRRGREPSVSLEEEELQLPDSAPDPEARRSGAEELRLGLQAFERLSEDCRSLLADLERGQTYREISRKTGLSEGALRVRASRCRDRAKKIRADLEFSVTGRPDPRVRK